MTGLLAGVWTLSGIRCGVGQAFLMYGSGTYYPCFFSFYLILRTVCCSSFFYTVEADMLFKPFFAVHFIFIFSSWLLLFSFWPSFSTPSSHGAPPASLNECMWQQWQQQQQHIAYYWKIRQQKLKQRINKNMSNSLMETPSFEIISRNDLKQKMQKTFMYRFIWPQTETKEKTEILNIKKK